MIGIHTEKIGWLEDQALAKGGVQWEKAEKKADVKAEGNKL